MHNMYFEPVIVFIKGNPDTFIGFQKEMGSFLDACQSTSTTPPLWKKKIKEARRK